ncbi:MAG: DUF2974 domain-containing protein [Lachnospiraceae bacterium]|nr:DUF2974 domain-containing protein [Lachnospiraceae bacterium]
MSIGNMFEYVSQYCTDTFLERPFGVEDAIVLAQLSYIKLDAFLKDFKKDSVDMCSLYDSPLRETLVADPKYKKDHMALLKAISASLRFKGLRARFYVNQVDTAEETQFSAVTFLLPDGMPFVAFRGTDETMLGWQEDFGLALKKPIAGQKLAADYLRKVAEFTEGPLMLGGHSKGGNLSLYAMFTVDSAIRDRVTKIYTLDAPGFRPEFIEHTDYDSVKKRIVRVVPKDSVVGLLFNDLSSKTVIEADAHGMAQHNMYTWIIKDGHVVETELSEEHLKSVRNFNQWVLSLDDTHLQSIVKLLSEMLDDTGAKTTVEFRENVPKYVKTLLKAAGDMDDTAKEQASAFIKSYVEFTFEGLKREVMDNIQSSRLSRFLTK